MSSYDTMAHAAPPGGAPGEPFVTIALLLGFIAIFYFLLWRPQAKRRKEHQELVSSLSKGDEVITAGGLVGQVTKVEDDFVKLQIGSNMEVRVQKSAVGSTLPKGTLKSLDGK